jgi:hypothetical protein
MRNLPLRTRVRAWLLRTFAGRGKDATAWQEEPAAPLVARSESFQVGELRVTASSLGIRDTGINPASVVYQVIVSREGDTRTWTSKYGLTPEQESPAAAAEIALDELDQAWRDPEKWLAEATAGMSEDEVEAMHDSPMVQADLQAATWIGPVLDGVREQTKAAAGRWLG